MNRLIWRAYPLLLDRHYIKVQIMEALDQIPKDIPQIKKLKLAQFKIGMTPLVLDNASIHIIPKSQLESILNDSSKANEIKKSNSSNFINFQEQQQLLFTKSQRSFLSNSTPLEKHISHSKSSANIDYSNYNFKQNNENQTNLSVNDNQTNLLNDATKVNNSNESLPPGFSIIKKIVEGNKNCSDYLKFCFHFEPNLEIGAEVEIAIRLIGTIPVAANFKLHSLKGHFIVAIPPKSGRLSIGIFESTNINFDITAQLGKISFNSEEWKSTWNSLKNWIHYFLHKIVINIPLEENLQKMGENLDGPEPKKNNNNNSNNNDKIDSEKERELLLQKIREKKMQKIQNSEPNKKAVINPPQNIKNQSNEPNKKVIINPPQNVKNQSNEPNKKVIINPSQKEKNQNSELNKKVVINPSQNEKKDSTENLNKTQKQLIVFKHSMTLWDYEF